MCDPELIAARLQPESFPRTFIGNPYYHREGRGPAAISCLSLEDLGYFDEKKEKNNKDEVDAEQPVLCTIDGPGQVILNSVF